VPASILVVCTGNVCRSPFIERVLQRGLDDAWGPGQVNVTSAGTGALAGRPMDPQAEVQLGELGTARGFVARDITPAMIADADLVLTATRRHRGNVVSMYPRALRYTFTYREFADLVRALPDLGPAVDAQERVRAVVSQVPTLRGMRLPLSDDDADIADPFRREDAIFVAMRDQVVDGLPAVLRALGAP
jgi:protein-tyrosine phosphatase